MTRIVLPSIEFRQTPLRDVLEALRQLSLEANPDPNPAGRAINLILNAPAVAAANPKITLSMRQIPLTEVLKYVASQAGLKVKAEPFAVSLVPLTDNSEPLVTATFRVQPAFFGNRTDAANGTNPLNQPAATAQ